MSWISDTASLYGRVFSKGAQLMLRAWPIVVTVLFYALAFQLAVVLAEQLGAFGPIGGLVGGMVQIIALAACMSSWLALVEQVLRSGQVTFAAVPASFGVYLSDLLAVGFLLFLLRFVAAVVLMPFPFLDIVVGLATMVFFNAVPELIYLGRYPAAALLMASYRFIGENWVEWFPPVLLLLSLMMMTLLVILAGASGLLGVFAVGVVGTFSWIVRGLLFLELTTSSRRGREYKRRAAM